MADEKKDTKAKGTRVQKPIYAVMQIMGEDGNPILIDKDKVRVIGGFRNADGVLDIMESGSHPGAFYKKVPLV